MTKHHDGTKNNFNPPLPVNLELPEGKIPCHELFVEPRKDNLNRALLIHSAIGIERQLEDIITLHILKEEENKFFKTNILRTSFFSFRVKFNIFYAILDELNEEDYRETFKDTVKLVEKVIKRRNEFAHGDFVLKNDDFYLYVKANTKGTKLDNAYWTGVEEIFTKASDGLHKIILLLRCKLGLFDPDAGY